MRKIVLGRTNASISAISLGTWAFGGANMSGKIPVGWSGQNDWDSKDALIRAWELDINHWDTADVYGEGNSEKIIGGMWNIIPRDKIFLATKVGWDKGPYDHWYNPKQMKINMERSLINLKSDYIDVIYLHHCNFGKDDQYFDDALETLKRFQKEGKTRFIGLSDWSSDRIMQFIGRCKPDIIQVYRNIMDDDYESSGLKGVIDQKNLGVCFFSPLKHGLLTGKYQKPATFDIGDHRSRVKAFSDKGVIKKLKINRIKLEKKFSNHPNPTIYGVINALFYDAPTGCVLIGQRNIYQVETAASLGELLSEDDSRWVKSIYKNL